MNKPTDSDFNVDSVIEAISILDSLSISGDVQEESELAKKLISYLRAVQEDWNEIIYIAGPTAIESEKAFLEVLEEVLKEEEFEEEEIEEDDSEDNEDEDDLDQTSSEIEDEEDDEDEEEEWEDMDEEENEEISVKEELEKLLKEKGISMDQATTLAARIHKDKNNVVE